MSDDGTGTSTSAAVVLDYLLHGRADDDRPQYQKPALGHALGVDDFGLFELVLESDTSVSIGDQVSVDPLEDGIESSHRIEFDDLSGGAQSELEHAVRELIDANEDRFVEFFNEAGAVTVRLHQFNLLPGVGDKIRDDIIDERRRNPFESLDGLSERVSGFHDPKRVLVERILAEIRDEDVKYKLFARPEG